MHDIRPTPDKECAATMHESTHQLDKHASIISSTENQNCIRLQTDFPIGKKREGQDPTYESLSAVLGLPQAMKLAQRAT